eukprot:Platyproteum_vivax@DN7477_c2_g4_i1.p1
MVKELFMEIIYELDGTTATDRNQLIKKLNENLAKPEYANFETPASIEMMEKLQKVNRPVATQHLMVDSELQDMSVRKVVDQVEPREEPETIPEEPEVDYPQGLRRQDDGPGSFAKRTVVFDQRLGEYVLKQQWDFNTI